MEMEYFYKPLWEMGVDNPEQREEIAKTVTSLASEYSIPVRKVSNLTGELEDITITIQEQDFASEKVKEKVLIELDFALHETVQDLATKLGLLHAHYRIKEARGEELTAQEKTLRDLDITALAFTLRFISAVNIKSYNTGADFEADRKKLLDQIKEQEEKE